MTDPATAAPAIAAPAPVVPETPAAKPQTLANDLPPEALALRIQQAKDSARRELLSELGVTDPNAAKAAIAASAAAAEAAKSDAEKLATANLRLAAYDAAIDVAVAQASREIDEKQRAAIDAIAGADKAAWLRTYGALAATWGKSAPAAAVAAIAEQVAPPAPVVPATTTPVAVPPVPPTGASQPVDHAANYAALRMAHPFLAQQYADRFGAACYSPKS